MTDKFRKLSLGLVTAIALALAGFPRSPAATVALQVAPKTGEVGSQLPEFSVKDFRGREISSAALRGKVVIVDFWATWCQPCKREMPGYQRLLDRYGSRGLVVIGFKATMMRDTEDPVRFAREIGVHYPLAVANPAIVEKFGGLQGLPTTFIYDRHGILRQKIIGFEYMRTIESEIQPLLATN